jgi:ASC-1-like (ASCH) protein
MNSFVASTWGKSLIKNLGKELKKDPLWFSKSSNIFFGDSKLHLAIFVEPFLQYMLEGKKTVETRFSINRVAPFEKVKKGDYLLLKKTGGPVVGITKVTNVWFYNIDEESIEFIRRKFGRMICAEDDDFWEERSKKMFATLMQVGDVYQFDPIFIDKKDRRGWVVCSVGDSKNGK